MNSQTTSLEETADRGAMFSSYSAWVRPLGLASMMPACSGSAATAGTPDVFAGDNQSRKRASCYIKEAH
jgi:hypothetical protein